MTAWAGEEGGAYASPIRQARARLTAALGWVASQLAAERDRWMLWSAPLLGLGIGVYFALPNEPSRLFLGASPVIGALVLVGRRRATPWAPLALAGFLIMLGLNAAQLRSWVVAAPVLAGPLGPVDVSGRIAEVDARQGGGNRLTIEDLRIAGLAPAGTPRRLRITVRGAGPELKPGDRVTLWAKLMPPAAPAAPGAFDFARRAWFQRLGGVGYALGAPRVLSSALAQNGSLGRRLAALRRDIAARAAAAPDAAVGAVAAALMTGHRGAIPEPVVEDLRRAGLAHLLAISGLHIGLVASVVFFALRALLALVPALALNYPIKKWAAVAAVAAALAYLLISGATIPTRRAFIMTAIVLLAVIFDRGVISMRPVALAAVAILLMMPEALLSISFQLSFAAVIALVAGYEAVLARAHGRGAGPRYRPVARIGVYFAMVILSTVIAELAIGPFAAYHFNRIVSYGLVANLIAIPVMGFWIMPAIVAAFALMPLGLEGVALAPMYAGIQVVLGVAHEVASWPGATVNVAAMPISSLIAIAVGGLWLCLWRRRWRLIGLVAIGAGLAFNPTTRRPDLLVDGTGKLFAVRDREGTLWLSSARLARRTGHVWLRRDGRGRDARPLVFSGVISGTSESARRSWLACDPLGCLYRPGLVRSDVKRGTPARAGGPVVAIVRDARALADDCRRADVVVSLVPVRGGCPSAARVIDRFDLWRGGAQALWFEGDDVRIASVAVQRGHRPWVVTPRRYRAPLAAKRSADSLARARRPYP